MFGFFIVKRKGTENDKFSNIRLLSVFGQHYLLLVKKNLNLNILPLKTVIDQAIFLMLLFNQNHPHIFTKRNFIFCKTKLLKQTLY